MQEYKGKVIIATFFYKRQSLLEYTHSLATTIAVLERMGIKYDYLAIHGNFHMELCINDILTSFLNDEEATDIIIIDSDESWNPQHLVRLLLHEEELVCGVYLQTDPKKRVFPVVLKTADDGHHIGKMLPDGNCLLEAEKCPAGFMRIKKSALQKWVAAYPDKWLYLRGDKIWTFFFNEIRDHVFHGMDFVFTEALKACGVQLWVDPICDISHWGMTEYRGTLDAYLRLLKVKQESGVEKAFEMIETMAKEIEARNG